MLLAPSARSQIYNITLYIRRPAVVLSLIPSICPSPLLPPSLPSDPSLPPWLGVRNATQWWPGIGPRGDRQSQQQSRKKMRRKRGLKRKKNESREKRVGMDERCMKEYNRLSLLKSSHLHPLFSLHVVAFYSALPTRHGKLGLLKVMDRSRLLVK